MPIIPPGFAQAVCVFQLIADPEPIVVTFGVDVSDAAGDNLGAANGVWAAFSNVSLRNLASNVYVWDHVDLYVGQDGGGTLPYRSANSTAAGTTSETMLPQNSAYLIEKHTGAPGRRNKGRMFWPAIGEARVDHLGNVAGATVTALQAAMTGLLTNLSGGSSGVYPNTPMVLLHSTPKVGVAGPPTLVTSLVVDPVISTQRQRLRR